MESLLGAFFSFLGAAVIAWLMISARQRNTLSDKFVDLKKQAYDRALAAFAQQPSSQELREQAHAAGRDFYMIVLRNHSQIELRVETDLAEHLPVNVLPFERRVS
jgi:hypothetical protein